MVAGKERTGTMLAVAVIALVAIVIVAYLAWPDNGGDEQELQVGDYLKYQYDVNNDSAVMWMNVTGVNEEGYEITSVLVHQNGYKETPDPFTVSKDLVTFWDTGDGDVLNDEDLVGDEVLNTSLGDRQVNHYRVTGDSGDWNYYIGTDVGVIYRIELVSDMEVIASIELVDTSVEWL